MRHATLAVAALLLVAAAPGRAAEAPFTVTRLGSTVHAVPPGSMGRKTTDRQLWVGNTDANRNTRVTYELTFGGFASQCPSAEGIVKGDFEYTIKSDGGDTHPDGTVEEEHHSRRLVLTLEGHVDEEAKLEYVELSGSFSVQRSGTYVAAESTHQTIERRRFTPGPQGEPDMPAMEAAVRATADIAIASAMLFAGFTYRAAEGHWRKLNECVQLSFDPPTDSQMLGANQSREVMTTLKTIAGGNPAPWKSYDVIRPIDGAGTVEPRRVDQAESATVKLTYTASDRPRRGHGIELLALSRAGIANDRWRILDRYEGTFSQVDTAQGAFSVASGEINETLTGRLVWTPDPPAGRASSFGDVPSSFFKATGGEITITHAGTGSNAVGPARCRTDGRHTFAITALPPAVLQHLSLEISADGRYRLQLLITDAVPSNYQADTVCTFPNRVVRQKTPAMLPALIIGEQHGALDAERAIMGEMAPRNYGPRRVTGEWSFRIP